MKFPDNDPSFKTGYMLPGGKACVTPVGRISYPWFFKTQPLDADDIAAGKEPKYSGVLLFPPDADFTVMQELLKDVLLNGKYKYGLDKTQWPAKFGTPFREQSEKKQDGYAQAPGHKFISASGKQRPTVLDIGNNVISDESHVYPGCFGRFVINAFDYKAKGNCGLSFGLQHVQFIAHGDPMGNRVPVEGAFKPVAAANPGAAAPATAAGLF